MKHSNDPKSSLSLINTSYSHSLSIGLLDTLDPLALGYSNSDNISIEGYSLILSTLHQSDYLEVSLGSSGYTSKTGILFDMLTDTLLRCIRSNYTYYMHLVTNYPLEYLNTLT